MTWLLARFNNFWPDIGDTKTLGLRAWHAGLSLTEGRSARRSRIVLALTGVVLGLLANVAGHSHLASWIWAAGTLPVVASLAVSIIRELWVGHMGVDAVAIVSMLAALILGETLAAAVVAVMYAGGNALEDFAISRAERDLTSLIDRAPRVAHRRANGQIEDIPVATVAIGDHLVVRSGEVIPVDGTVVDCAATIDEAALTGEPIPVVRAIGDPLYSGTINVGDTFELMARATAGESTYAGIVRMVTAAQTAKSPFIRLADRFALLLLPVSLLLAAAAWILSGDPIRGLAVLVAATPCPLILAAPVAFIAGVAQAARRGILIKGGGPLEALARAHTVIFDKTGTLTVGGARLIGIEARPGQSADDILRLCAALDQASHHVVARAIVAAAKAKSLQLDMPTEVHETPGAGLEGTVDGHALRLGSLDFVSGGAKPDPWAMRILRRAGWRSALTVFVTVDDKMAGALLLGDELRREAPRAVQALRASGMARIIMVTGDRAEAAETIGAALNLDAVLADRAPSDKVAAVATEQRLHPTVMVGDGINDAPALAAADVGIAMGARGASASSEAAGVVILVDRLDRASEAVVIARRARAIAMQSIIVGMGLSGVAMLAAAFGFLPPIAGALTQEAIDVAVILNALRALWPGGHMGRALMNAASIDALTADHVVLTAGLDRLRAIADALDDAAPVAAVDLIGEASEIVTTQIIKHEHNDEDTVYPSLIPYLARSHELDAMSRAHREIAHLSRLLARLADGLKALETDRYVVRDAQRIIESIETLVRMHTAQEEDIYHSVASS